jgi:peptide chain release factor 1
MARLPTEKIRELERRFGEVEARMAAGPDPDAYVKLASEYSDLQPLVAEIRSRFDAALAERLISTAMLAGCLKRPRNAGDCRERVAFNSRQDR